MSLVLLDPAVCPVCRSPLDFRVEQEPALIRCCGHGGTRETVREVCAGCGWQHVAAVTEVRPDVA